MLVRGRGLVGAARPEAVPAEQRPLGEGDVVGVAEGEHPVGRAPRRLPVLERDEGHHRRVAVLRGRREVDVLGRAVPGVEALEVLAGARAPRRGGLPRRAPGSRTSRPFPPRRRRRRSRRDARPGARRRRAASRRTTARFECDGVAPAPPARSRKSVASASVRAWRRVRSGCHPLVQPRSAVHCDQKVPPGVRLAATWSSTAFAAAT